MFANRDRYAKYGFCLLAVPVVIINVGLIRHQYPPSEPLKALPESATNVQELYRAGFGNNYAYRIKATLPVEDFPVYAKSLGLIKRFNPSEWAKTAVRPFSSGRGFGDPAWFNPPDRDAKIDWYWRRGTDTTIHEWIVWHDGSVYYRAVRT